MPDALLEVKNLHASYGATEALHGIDFGLPSGRITTILGANGAGKTTTLRAICQMVRTSGSALFEGQQLVGERDATVGRSLDLLDVADHRAPAVLIGLGGAAHLLRHERRVVDDLRRVRVVEGVADGGLEAGPVEHGDVARCSVRTRHAAARRHR